MDPLWDVDELLTNPRLHIASATTSASAHPGHWLLGFRWRHYAHLHFLRPCLLVDDPHILILRCLCPYLPLAAHDHHFPVSSLPRKEAQHPPQPNRLLRLRPGSAVARYDPLYPAILPPSDCIRLLPDLCKCTYRRHRTQSSTRDGPRMFKSLSAVCRYAATQGSRAATRRHLFRVTRHEWRGGLRQARLRANSLRPTKGQSL